MSVHGAVGFLCVAALWLGSSLPAAAHHSFSAEFDVNATGEITGEIRQVWFANPHVRYRLDVAGEDGAVEEWELQMSNITTLRNYGFGADTLEVGDRVTASGELGRRGVKKLWARSIRTADGTELLAGRVRARPDGPEQLKNRDAAAYAYGMLNRSHPFDISGAWSNSYKFRVTVDDLEPKPTPFTAEGRRIFESTEHIDDYALRCLAPGLPRVFGAPYNMEIVDAGTHYLVVYIEHNTPRRIYMDGRAVPADMPATSMGFSVGRWEDDVLVVETTKLLAGWLDGSGLPMSGDGTRIVERWELADDRLSMDRIMTIYDPYYTEPLVRRRASSRGENVELIEQASCDPDSYYRDLLESGRLEEHLHE